MVTFAPQDNVNRLKSYRSNLVIFPRNAKKPKVRCRLDTWISGSS